MFKNGGKNSMIYGYARVSTKGQARDGNSLQAQTDELKKNGATKILEESFTGTKLHRPVLDKLLNKLEDGDIVIVTKLDRIARNARDGIDIIDAILSKGCSIRILNMGLFDNSPSGKLMRTVMLAFAEFERDMIVQRTQEGKAIAKQNPNFREGRPKKFKKEQLSHAYELINSGISYKEVETMTGISRSTLARLKRDRISSNDNK